MAPAASGAGAGTLKTLEKLERSVKDGKYYEAQQMYKTIYARYMAAKKYTEALDLLQSGASVQFRHCQVTCGVELAVLLVDAISTMKLSYSDDVVARIKAIANEFPRTRTGASGGPGDAKARLEGMQSFVKAAIKWSSEYGGPSRGAPELHDILAEYMWTESPQPDITRASYHFVRGSRPDVFAEAILGAMIACPDGERDILLARGVLLYLTLGNMRDANKLADMVQSRANSLQFSDVVTSHLTHFIKFILLTLERDALPLFKMLRENYKASIERDPALNELLDIVAEKFYNVRRSNNFLGDFMKMFTEGAH